MKNKLKSMMLILLLIFVEKAIFAGCEQKFKINLIFENNTVMIYSGSDSGIRVGDVMVVEREDIIKGKVEVLKVEKSYCIAEIIQQDKRIEPFDSVKIEQRKKVEEEEKEVKELKKEKRKKQKVVEKKGKKIKRADEKSEEEGKKPKKIKKIKRVMEE